LASYQYAYDVGSRFTSIDSYLDGLTEYTHDNTDQLTGADHTGQTDESYEYDENGNRTMSGYDTGNNNQLLSDGTYDYTYDDEGNRLTRTNIATGHVTRYEWDHRNRLASVTEEDDEENVLSVVEHQYDVFNRWVKRTVDSDGPGSAAAVDTYFAHEDGQIVLDFDVSAASDLTHRYLWSDRVDQILASEDVTSLTTAGNTLWPLTDHLGTTRDLADRNESTGVTTVTNHRRFDFYGNLLTETNSSIDLLFAFTGRPLDESTGLQNNLNRWYDAAPGRWISEDPIGFAGHDFCLTRYVRNDTLRGLDATGLVWAGPYTEEVAWDRRTSTITFNEDCLIIILYGHGSAKSPHIFKFGKFPNTAAAFNGCDAGSTNKKIPKGNQIPGCKLTDGEVQGGRTITDDETKTVKYWKEKVIEGARQLADSWIKAGKCKSVKIIYVLAGSDIVAGDATGGGDNETRP
jgi:RHS repeat-associated protein